MAFSHDIYLRFFAIALRSSAFAFRLHCSIQPAACDSFPFDISCLRIFLCFQQASQQASIVFVWAASIGSHSICFFLLFLSCFYGIVLNQVCSCCYLIIPSRDSLHWTFFLFFLFGSFLHYLFCNPLLAIFRLRHTFCAVLLASSFSRCLFCIPVLYRFGFEFVLSAFPLFVLVLFCFRRGWLSSVLSVCV